MTNSRHLAGLIGPTLIVLSVSEALNLRAMAAAAGPNLLHVTYLNGTLLFVAGLSIVRVHSEWSVGWPVLITLTGWVMLFIGLARMFAPVATQRPEQYLLPIFAFLVVLLGAGIVLSVKGYGGDSRSAETSQSRYE